MVIKLYGIIFIFVFALAGSISVHSHGQTMEEIMKEMAEAAKKGEQSQYSGTYQPAPQQTYQPMTPAQSQQYTTDKLLRALSEASKRPAGETDFQRQQRLNNLTNDMRNQDAVISQRQNDYYNARTKRMSGGGTNYTLDELAAPNTDYVQQREQRLSQQKNTAGSVQASSAQVSSAKPAGFKQPKPSGLSVNQSRSSGTAPDWGDDIDDLSAKDERLKDAPATKSTPIGCLCKGGDELIYGVQCVGSKSYVAAINPPFHPWTQACTFPATIWSHERK